MEQGHLSLKPREVLQNSKKAVAPVNRSSLPCFLLLGARTGSRRMFHSLFCKKITNINKVLKGESLSATGLTTEKQMKRKDNSLKSISAKIIQSYTQVEVVKYQLLLPYPHSHNRGKSLPHQFQGVDK